MFIMYTNYLDEVWVDIPGYEKKYQVSNYGHIRSLNYHREHRLKIMGTFLSKAGYVRVCLCLNGEKKKHLVHRLVWEAFNGPIPEGMQVNHINENKADNCLSNLNLMNPTENLNYGKRSRKAAISKSKPVKQYDLEGNLVKTWQSAKEVQNILGFWHGPISAACRGVQKTAYGYRWTF